MQLRLPFRSPSPPAAGGPDRAVVVVGRRSLTVTCVRHPRARRYLLRVDEDGGIRVTLPRRGSRAEALRFVREKIDWIERERYRIALERATAGWVNARQALVDGCWVDLTILPGDPPRVRVAGHEARARTAAAQDVASAAHQLLRAHAARVLPARIRALAAAHGYRVAGVAVRDQRSRWGSCSASGRISLNWRLVQMPPPVRDYILLHELAHIRHPDHSRRFWREVERLCPGYREARHWLAEHGGRALSDPGLA
ncbi:MAG TPA: SprT family zinc-dependent metalloprotease [Vicinamibacterales bacterium]|nr:SprT family zinc-dependent metalloprotease [Vicinamibacterales bacterium]